MTRFMIDSGESRTETVELWRSVEGNRLRRRRGRRSLDCANIMADVHTLDCCVLCCSNYSFLTFLCFQTMISQFTHRSVVYYIDKLVNG